MIDVDSKNKILALEKLETLLILAVCGTEAWTCVGRAVVVESVQAVELRWLSRQERVEDFVAGFLWEVKGAVAGDAFGVELASVDAKSVRHDVLFAADP